MNTPNPCGKCLHLYCDPMVPDEEIARAPYLLGRECKVQMPMPDRDQSDQYCPKFHPWNLVVYKNEV